MAEGDITFFNKFKKAQLDGAAPLSSMPVDFDTDTIKLAVLTAEPDTGDSSTDEHWDDVSADQVSTGGTEYTGPVTLGSVNITLSSGVVSVDYADVVINQDASGFSNGTWVVVFKDTGTPATSPLILKGELGTAKGNTGGSLTFSWHTNGLFQLS